jgi:hypothetical protein
MSCSSVATCPTVATCTSESERRDGTPRAGARRSRPSQGRSSAARSRAASGCPLSSSHATVGSAASSGRSTWYVPACNASRNASSPASVRNHRFNCSRSAAPGAWLVGCWAAEARLSSARSSSRSGASPSSRPDAKPPCATSSVTHAGVPATGVRLPMVRDPSAMPASTDRHIAAFSGTRTSATDRGSWMFPFETGIRIPTPPGIL